MTLKGTRLLHTNHKMDRRSYLITHIRFNMPASVASQLRFQGEVAVFLMEAPALQLMLVRDPDAAATTVIRYFLNHARDMIRSSRHSRDLYKENWRAFRRHVLAVLGDADEFVKFPAPRDMAFGRSDTARPVFLPPEKTAKIPFFFNFSHPGPFVILSFSAAYHMIVSMNKEEHIKFWMKSAEEDFQAMIHLSQKNHNTWALFIGHLVLEKLLKAWYIKKNSSHPPFIHDLVRLSEKGNLLLDDDQKDLLDTISTFNIRGRYDDFNREFYKKCTNEFTQKWIRNISELKNG